MQALAAGSRSVQVRPGPIQKLDFEGGAGRLGCI